MLALVRYGNGPKELEVRDIPEPEINDDNQVKVKIKFTGICGTDIGVYSGKIHLEGNRAPFVWGHELTGEVVAVGPKVTRFKVGDKVTGCASVYCGECYYCRHGNQNVCLNLFNKNGAYTSYAVMEERHLFKLPDHVSFEEGALAEMLACVVHGMVEQASLKPNDTVAVIGPGPLGLMAASVAKLFGCRVLIIGTKGDAERLEVAKSMGFSEGLFVEENVTEQVKTMTDGLGVNVVAHCAGSEPSVNLGLDIIKKKGTYVELSLFGKPIRVDWERIMKKNLSVYGAVGHNLKSFETTCSFLARSDFNLKPIITGTFSVKDWQTAFERIVERKEIKALIYPIDGE